MNIHLSELLLIGIIGAVLVYWWNSQGLKQRALKAVKIHCEKMDVQLLDESLVLKHLWPKRDDEGQLKFTRRFEFEFSSTGDIRYHGYAIMHGQIVQSIHLEPYRIS